MKNKIKGLSETRRAEVARFIEEGVSERLVNIYNLGYEAGYVDAKESAVGDETILYHGLKLRKVNRGAREGDYIRPNDQTESHSLDDGVIYGPVNRFLCVGKNNFDVYTNYHNRTTETVEVFEVVVNEGVNCPTPIEKTPNKLRAELIQRAKAFVEKYQAVRAGSKPHKKGNSTATRHFYETEFFTKDRKVTAVIYRLKFGKERLSHSNGEGRAVCVKDEVFNEHIGKAIALGKALEIDIPLEFMNAVQPNSPAVGMITYKHSNNNVGVRTIKELVVNHSPENFPGQAFETHEKRGFQLVISQVNIIDDTNAIYEVI